MRIDGFLGGVPQDQRWERQLNDLTFVFTKSWEKNHFVYNCRLDYTHDETGYACTSSTGFATDRDLTPQEIERRPQFVEFLTRN